MRFPQLYARQQSQIQTNQFLGYNHNMALRDGEFFNQTNISPRVFPLFAPRKPRGNVKTLDNPQGILARDALVYVDGSQLFINGLAVTGLTLSTLPEMCPKQLVSMGAYIIVFPDKKYVNTANLTDVGSLESEYSYTGKVTYTPARVDGTPFPDNIPIMTEPPENPNNADYWIDISGEKAILRQFSELSGTWAEVPSMYVKVSLPGVGKHFAKYDGVTIAGAAFAGSDMTLSQQLTAINGSHVIYDIADGYIVLSGFINAPYTQENAQITITRKVPVMDFVVENHNRLWGCKYGFVDGKTVNEIYACKLGDFKNWNCFMGVSTDSYVASVGTDGKFTGAIAHLGHPIFFKETCLHKVFGEFPSNFQIEALNCRGVQEGSHRSVQRVNEMVFYKGRTEVLAYDGSLPMGISDALGGIGYSDARAGVYKDSYYISMKDEYGKYHLFMYDTKRRLWFREDNVKALAFAQLDDELFYIDEDTKVLTAMYGTSGTLEERVEWSAETGIVGYEYPNRKYCSRFNIRVKMNDGDEFRVYMRYDSEGDWEEVGHAVGRGVTRTFLMPVRPRRCDHFEIKISGHGDVRVYSFARILEIGSDGQ